MCEFMIVYGGDKMPKCDYTKELCTFCVFGNAITYKEAKEAEKRKGADNERKAD